MHDPAFDHPYVLVDCPFDMLAAFWNDSLYVPDGYAKADGLALLDAWQAKRKIMEAAR